MLTLIDRLKLYIRLFAARPDLTVWEQTFGSPAHTPELPEHAREVLSDHTVRLGWTFSEPYEGTASSDGGFLWLAADHERGWQSSVGRWLEDVSGSLLIDDHVEEGQGLLIIPEGETMEDAVPAFFNANDETLRRFEGLEDYLTQGARRGFVWYWQSGEDEAQELLERLHEGSLEGDEGELRAGLQAQGASDDEADALIAWLGEDARLLVPA